MNQYGNINRNIRKVKKNKKSVQQIHDPIRQFSLCNDDDSAEIHTEFMIFKTICSITNIARGGVRQSFPSGGQTTSSANVENGSSPQTNIKSTGKCQAGM